MAPLPTIANIFRVAFEFTGGPINPVSVLNFECTDTADVTAIAAALGTALTAPTHSPWYAMSSTYSTTSVFITPLDGTTAGTSQPLGVTTGGGIGGEEILEAAIVASFHTARRGSRGRGRTFIGPITEGSQDGGIVQSSPLTITLDSWAGWHAALLANSPQIVPVVASYKHADAHPIVGLRIDSTIATQRRRLLRVRP